MIGMIRIGLLQKSATSEMLVYSQVGLTLSVMKMQLEAGGDNQQDAILKRRIVLTERDGKRRLHIQRQSLLTRCWTMSPRVCSIPHICTTLSNVSNYCATFWSVTRRIINKFSPSAILTRIPGLTCPVVCLTPECSSSDVGIHFL